MLLRLLLANVRCANIETQRLVERIYFANAGPADHGVRCLRISVVCFRTVT
jgi:hypothetical protein